MANPGTDTSRSPAFCSLHLVKSAQPECTGICRIILGLAKYAKSRDYEVSVLFFEDGPWKAQMLAAGINAHALSWDGRNLTSATRTWLWLRRNPAQILHVHWGGRMLRAVCGLSGAGVVIAHVHSRIDESTGDVAHNLAFPWTDAVIANSKAVASCISRRMPEVIYAGIEVDPAPRSLLVHTGPLKVGVLSRLVHIKNIEAVIQAAAQLKDLDIEIHVDIAGCGPFEPFLRNAAQELKVADRVCFLGWRKDIDELLSGWDLLVMPSIDEGLGISALEAMAASRPVIGTRVGGLPELVVDGVTGYLIPPRDTDALVQRILGLANDRTKLAEMGEAGWNRAQKDFSVEAMANKITSLYDRLLQNRQVQPF